eukprot:TRINITY_DN2489_c0_g1_i1.p1 TRINITY_DN2489_c0_g1~~TRINITY_DN2489_c0_g1_i1.p1  ORF type:complete len:175 (+),score=35.04 TRINITY_DN2489_c0_g1_i1:493-1017(+)
MPLVELSPAEFTSKETIDKVKELMTGAGSKPVVINKEVAGFVQNRLQYALLGEALRLVEDDILSPEDVDNVVKYGLATRWSFMGVFQTIDLNAPNGVSDYCDRYLGNVYRVLQTEDNNREISSSTVEKINEWQRSLYPVEDIQRIQSWRDIRLTSLVKHFNDQKDIDSTYFDKE